ncbi:MAG: NADH-quinone oxidoreductase subunit A [Thermoguttaceae bacterium]|jgi:NADH-quinone oxidoreductase subunit A
MQTVAWPIFIFVVCVIGLASVLLIIAKLFNPIRPGRVKRMPYESGMDPFHDTRRRFDVRFYLLAIAFMVFDVELLFLYPWAVATRPARLEGVQSVQAAEDKETSPPVTPGIDAAVVGGLVQNRNLVFAGAMLFIALLTLGFVYDWRKGIFHWR